jgi:hypothetical protein
VLVFLEEVLEMDLVVLLVLCLYHLRIRHCLYFLEEEWLVQLQDVLY